MANRNLCNLFLFWLSSGVYKGAAMKLKEKIRRKVKYYRVGMQQSSCDDRLAFGFCALVLGVFIWWEIVVL